MTNNNRDSDRILKQAREWFVTLQSGQVSSEQQLAFERWRQTPAHQCAYAEYERVWQALGELQHSPEGRALAEAQPRVVQMQSRWLAGVVAMAASVLVAVFFFSQPELTAPETYQSGRAQILNFTLADGSELVLGPESRLEYIQDEQHRKAHLLAGEAFFAVAKDPSRPFEVQATDLRVKVLGTRFNVKTAPASTRVVVEEGRVGVAGLAQAGESLQLIAGQAAESQPGLAPTQLAAGAFSPAGDWRYGRLEYLSAPLAEVIADVNRYRQHQLVLASPVLKSLRVTLSLKTDGLDDINDLLEASLPISIRPQANGDHLVFPE